MTPGLAVLLLFIAAIGLALWLRKRALKDVLKDEREH